MTTVTTDTTDSRLSLAEGKPVTTGVAAVCVGIACLLMGNAFLERGIELIASADTRDAE